MAMGLNVDLDKVQVLEPGFCGESSRHSLNLELMTIHFDHS